MLAFLKEDTPEKGWWTAVIVEPQENKVGIVVDFATRASKPEIDAYVSGWLGPDRAIVYEAPPLGRG